MAVNTTSIIERPSTKCPCCGEDHYMARCASFLNLTNKERLELVNNKRLCSNCFRPGHWVRDCNSSFSCRTCGRKHHSLIHPGFTVNNTTEGNTNNTTITKVARHGTSTNIATGGSEDQQQEPEVQEPVGSYAVGTKTGIYNVFLSTVVLQINDQNGNKHLARALLDNGSQANIISERMCQILKLKRRPVNIPICGVGQSENLARFAVSTHISSRVTEFSIGIDFLVLQRVTSQLPSVSISTSHWRIPAKLQLADPEFNICNKIDLIIGAEHFYQFLYEREMSHVPLGRGLPVLVDTVFGWVVSGKCSDLDVRSINCCVATSCDGLVKALERFWQAESIDEQPHWSKEEQDCETHYIKTHKRLEDGRYEVFMPKHVNFTRMVGNSKDMALNRFIKLEKRLERDTELKQQYCDFMREYLDLGHMRKLSEAEVQNNSEASVYYLPHHAVVKEASTTTKTLSNGHNWRHIAGKDNPADLVSRGMTADEFAKSEL
ncbi:uncharacterized protein LOC128739336 [Sabethes cyaneus]|uniref:uncharacterized protein LOC128739336 n=1 Tax=Sabethes cyaneus TaxID=53552 RepID=UPI00237DCEB8|nr:uncharacterized protein LOC128739336 [Sabethes cyaneus]